MPYYLYIMIIHSSYFGLSRGDAWPLQASSSAPSFTEEGLERPRRRVSGRGVWRLGGTQMGLS